MLSHPHVVLLWKVTPVVLLFIRVLNAGGKSSTFNQCYPAFKANIHEKPNNLSVKL